jgi:pyruvate formate lyase activating enzyme
MAELAMESGGCIKLDLKAWDEGIHHALCGVTHRRTMENFSRLAERAGSRPEPPFLIASTLLVPGYIDEEEVGELAAFIARLNPDIPYSLLGFYPHFYLKDLPRTSRDHALRCRQAAERAGLTRVHVGNAHLLDDSYG